MLKHRIVLAVLFCVLPSLCFAEQPLNASQQQHVHLFINKMVHQHHFNREDLIHILNRAEFNTDVISKMTRPYESKPWHVYRNFFITEQRIAGGVQFWKKNQKILQQVQQRYGVPPQIIVAIIGIETNYGQHLGSYSTLDTLYTLAFNYPRRSQFFESELAHFLLLCREQKLNPFTVKGSYAGAIGLPQFMPSSYRFYAIDNDGSKRIDLVHDQADAIASVANYLSKAGWKPNQPVAVPATVKGKKFERIEANSLKPNMPVARLEYVGIKPITKLSFQQNATFIQLMDQNQPEYWLGLHNFYVISRYNPQLSYTMAVYLLSEEIKADHRRQLLARR